MNSLIQPYIAMSAFKYYKTVVNCHGISHFYHFKKDTLNYPQAMAVPDGCIDILFSFNEGNPSAQIYGSVLQPTLVFDDDVSDYFGVRFYPGGGYKFKDVKIQEIINNVYSFTELLNAEGLVEKIVTSDNFSDKVNLFTHHYQQHLYKQNIDMNPMTMKEFMLNKIMATNGQIRVGELAAATGYSERYVNSKFIEYFGIRPKVFCKIIRFQNVLNQLKFENKGLDSNSLIHVANDAGYFDQAHMYKDFSEFSSQTPGQYMKLLKKTDYTNKLILVNNSDFLVKSLLDD